jgi:hypothetical protein
MAGTIVTGMVSTEEQLGPSAATVSEGEKVVDMDDKIRKLKPDETQFSTMSDRLSSRAVTREKANWMEEEDFPRIVSGDAQTNVATTLNLNAGQGKIVQANDMLRNMRTGEGVRITVVATDALTIARGVGSTAAAAMNAGDQYLVVGDAQPQGSDFPTARYLQRVLGYNFTQITRTPWTFTATDTAIEKYGGREPAKEAKRQARIHKRKWESIGFWGMRSFIASSVAPAGNTEPQGSAGGLIEYIQTYKRDANGPLTPTFFDTFLMDVMANGSTDKVFFAAPLLVLSMSQWNRSGMGSQWDPTPRNVHGVNVDAFISGAYGYRIPVVVKKEWSEFPSANKGYGSYGFLVDMEYVERRPLRDRDTKLLTEQQPKGRDSYSAEYLCEATYEIVHERAHGIIFGATAPP